MMKSLRKPSILLGAVLMLIFLLQSCNTERRRETKRITQLLTAHPWRALPSNCPINFGSDPGIEGSGAISGTGNFYGGCGYVLFNGANEGTWNVDTDGKGASLQSVISFQTSTGAYLYEISNLSANTLTLTNGATGVSYNLVP